MSTPAKHESAPERRHQDQQIQNHIQESSQPITSSAQTAAPAATGPNLPPTALPPHSLITTAATAPVSSQTPVVAASWAASLPGRPAMIFSDIYKSPRSPIAKLRHHSLSLPSAVPDATTPEWVADEYADLLSKDKAKQKEAVKRYLADKVKTDWVFHWPSRVIETSTIDGEKPPQTEDAVQQPAVEITETVEPAHDGLREDPGYQVDEESDIQEQDEEDEEDEEDDEDAQSTYSTVSEDPIHYKPRMEWASDLSDEEAHPSRSPFRFDSPDTVGPEVEAKILVKRAQRRREVRKEMEWNEGLACFEARRNAWTGARTVRVRTKPVSPPALSPKSPRRFFFRRSMSGSPPSLTHSALHTPGGDGSDGSSLARSDDKDLRKQQTKDSTPSTPLSSRDYPVETIIPLAKPLLPPNNPLRASITPSVYLNLYEKVIVHNLTPSCPINLADMLRSCVAGWKRDGEWPPRPILAPPIMAKPKKKKAPKPETSQKEKDTSGTNIARRMSFGLLGRDKDDEPGAGKGIRRSLQRALGIGSTGSHEIPAPTPTPAPALG